MTNMLIKGLIATAVLTALAGCNSDDDKVPTTCAEAGAACKTFTILHTNDNHGRFWENKDGEYGLAAQKTLVDQIRAEVSKKGGQTLLLSGGDINTGVPESDLQDAIPDFTGMNKIGYDAMAVGNHEFDNPLSVVDMQRSLAEFPMLAANIYKADGTRYFDAYKIFDVNGVKIAVIGLTTEDTAKIGNPEYISELEFRDPKKEVANVIKEIKEAKSADIIFAVTHMGHYADGQHGSNAPGDVALARSLKEGDLQVVIGGHSQNPVCMEQGNKAYAAFKPGDACAPDQQNGTWIMQAHEWGKYVGRADFEYFNGELHLASYKLVPVNLVKEVTDEAGNNGERANVRNKQTNLGRMLAMAQSGKVSADFGVMNSGGVRASIKAGNITYRDVLTVQPFGNMVTLNEMTGAAAADYLGAVGSLQIGSGGYAQITGVKMTIDCVAKKATVHEINGKAFSATATYKFTVPSFNAAGGDGYPKLTSPIQTGYVDADLLYSFLKDKQSIVAADYNPVGDIVYENSDSVEGCKITAK